MPTEISAASRLPPLPADVITALNTIASWLAVDDFSAHRDNLSADAIILAGNAILTTIDGACALAKARNIPLFVSGGIGHSTSFLTAAIAQHPRYRTIDAAARPEAAILHDIATRFWALPGEQVFMETASRNSGENASFTRALLEQQRFTSRNIILIQDPLLQRRTDATFRHCWSDAVNRPTFINWPTYIPHLANTNSGIGFSGGRHDGLWPVNRFISLLLGEIPRLRDDQQGYGPKGKRFICHVDIPKPVEDAWQALMQNQLIAEVWRDRIDI
ncbi:YdcF family protein [Acerihabitans arboris]|uniref:YdcF family protein n=1 Tax=Acerihabitans arboris TaxID=2691583 RepID=A0A845SN46_9GAMM|nr:YdcF family protein [Acerihabitans arboris]NDL64376.1 YdcF family protein [Acerihabitans arboris]